MILFEKFGQHQPLNRQSERCARGRRGEPVDAGRPGGRLRHSATARVCVDRAPVGGGWRTTGTSESVIDRTGRQFHRCVLLTEHPSLSGSRTEPTRWERIRNSNALLPCKRPSGGANFSLAKAVIWRISAGIS